MSNGSLVALTPLQQLEADLRACVGKDGVFRLKKNSIVSSSIDAIFGLFVPETGEIAVSGASVGIPVGLDFVQVTGGGASAPFDKTNISAEFTIQTRSRDGAGGDSRPGSESGRRFSRAGSRQTPS